MAKLTGPLGLMGCGGGAALAILLGAVTVMAQSPSGPDVSTSTKNTLKAFTQDHSRSLIELSDDTGAKWQIFSVTFASGATFYQVIAQDHTVGVDALMKAGAAKQPSSAIVLTDVALKERALRVLDTAFLESLRSQTQPFEEWLKKNGDLTYGSAPRTNRVDVAGGHLGYEGVDVVNGEIKPSDIKGSNECTDVGGDTVSHKCRVAVCNVINECCFGWRHNCPDLINTAESYCSLVYAP